MATRRIKPTLETQFHIDYSWWERDDKDLQVYLISHLPPEKQTLFSPGAAQDDTEVDWVDPDTAEVKKVNQLQMALQEASQAEDFITTNTSLVDSVFRAFLANNNTPLTPMELGETVGRSPETILRTLSGKQVYQGIRPITG